MGKKLLILTAVLSLAALSSAFSAVENIKVSGDIALQGITRDFSFGESYDNMLYRDAEGFFLSQIRVRLDADLTENVSAVVRLISEEIWSTNNADDVEIDLGYVELKEFLYQPLTLAVGRQNLRYGNALIIGDPDTNQAATLDGASLIDIADDLSLRKSYDAVKAILDFSPWVLDLVYAQIDEGLGATNFVTGDGHSTDIDDDVRLIGGNLAYTWSSFSGITEGYFWVFDNNRDSTYDLENTQRFEDQTTTYVLGGRLQFNPIEKLALGVEGAYEFGDVLVDRNSAGAAVELYQHLSAFAAQAVAEYHFATKYNPKLGLRYSYLSGEDDTDDERFTGWDPVTEDQTAGEIINILFPNSTSQTIMLYGSIMPREDITLGLSYIWTKLAQNIPHTEASDFGLAGPGITATTVLYTPWVGPADNNFYAVDRDDTYLGSEVDAYALYDYTEDVQIKLSGAWFIPGDFFLSDNDDVAYSLRGGLTVNF